ncbi:MAG: DUF4153 domain-containing protein, partial [Longimicrobiales bacterium]
MNTRTVVPVTAILAAGVGMGSAGDFLLRGSGAPGLNFALLFAGLAVSVNSVALAGGPRLSREAVGWLSVGTLLAMGLLWRGSELLRFLAFVSAGVAFALPALHAGRAWVRQAGVADLVEAVAAAGLHAGFGGARLLQRAQWEAVGAGESRGTARSVGRSAAVGVLLATVPLGIFGALFLSADPVFAQILGEFVRIDLASFASHSIVIAILSWLACGYLAGFSSGTRLDGLRALGWEAPKLEASEVAIALGLVDLLFLGFVFVQFRYLFGGAEMVEVTPGLTYAAYAREGFFQLVVATALGLPWLLAADSLLGEKEESARWVFRALAGAQLVLLLAIVISALQRMRAYLDAYGLTEDRFVATAVLLWLAVLVVWFGATVLRGHRDPFAFGALVSGFGLVAALHLMNPTAYAARSHLDRAEAPPQERIEAGAPVDVTYLAALGSDAAPILVGRMDELTEAARCQVASALLARWGPDQEWDWRSWNLADWRAR